VESPGAGGGAVVTATASGGEARLGQAVERRVAAGEKPAQGREAAGQRLGDTWTGAERRWGGRGGAHGRDSGGGARQRKTEERGREVDEKGPGCNFQKRQALHCNA
jgi:hypothetical protein